MCAIITAASPSAEPVQLAANICRDRGRIVVVGTVDLGVSRQTMYRKELSLTLSRSYGPGRYDSRYEEEGLDYPIGYVRWTEKRNMEAFLQLLASGAVDVAPLIERRCSVEQGSAAYEELKNSGAYTILVEYPLRTLIQSAVAIDRFTASGASTATARTASRLYRRRKLCARGDVSSLAEEPGSGSALSRDSLGRGRESARLQFHFARRRNPAN